MEDAFLGLVPGTTEVAAATGSLLPVFWLGDLALWFAQVENEFALSRITPQAQMYFLLIRFFLAQAVREVRDIILTLASAMSDSLKKALITRFVASKHRQLQQLLAAEELGDRHPTECETTTATFFGR